MKHEDLQIIYHENLIYRQDVKEAEGIRDRGGYLMFFPRVTYFQGQDERYDRELAEKQSLVEDVFRALEGR